MDDSSAAQDLVDALRARGQDGAAILSDEDLRRLLPLLVMSCMPPRRLGDFSPAVQAHMREFLQRLQLRSDASATEFQTAVTAHYTTNPLPSAAMTIVRQWVRAHAASKNTRWADDFGRVLGTQRAPHAPKNEEGGERAGPDLQARLRKR